MDLKNMDLTLKPGSPAIDALENPGYPLDFENKRIPFGEGPDTGACEYALE